MRHAFTNYTPFYSYLLLVAAQLDALASPLTLIKAISGCFELGCAVLVAEMVWQSTKVPMRAAVAFACVWLAPTVLLNGAAWGQADSIWTFFILWSVSLWMRERNGMLPFAVAVSVKAQAVFLGPMVLAMIIRRGLHWAWLLVVPAAYLAIAAPVLVAGRPIDSVLSIYLVQADTFHRLTMNAANIWMLSGDVPYAIGVKIGLVLGAAAGAALSLLVVRIRRDGAELVLLAACASVLLMPLVLPKVHDRYFYAFELFSIALAGINLRYLAVPVLAQVSGVLAYLAFDPGIPIGLPTAALCNVLLGYGVVASLGSGRPSCPQTLGEWSGIAVAATATLLTSAIFDPSAATGPHTIQFLAALFGGSFILFLATPHRCAKRPTASTVEPAGL